MTCAKTNSSENSQDLRWKQRTLNLALLPWCLQNPKASIIQILKNKTGKYDSDLDGIVISFKNVKVLQNFGCIRQDTAEINVDVQIDFLIFKPEVGWKLYGIINKKNMTHLSVLVHKKFNVVIPRPTDDLNFKWIGDQLNVGQKIAFTIAALDLFGALPYIRGELDENISNITELEEENLEVSNKLAAVKVSFDAAKPRIIENGSDINENSSQNASKTDDVNSTKLKNRKKKSTIDIMQNDPETSDKYKETKTIKKNSVFEKTFTQSDDSIASTKNITKSKDTKNKLNCNNEILNSCTSSADKIENNKKRKRKRSNENNDNAATHFSDSSETGNKRKKTKLKIKSSVAKEVSTNGLTAKREKNASDSDSSTDDIIAMRNKILQQALHQNSSKSKNKKSKS